MSRMRIKKLKNVTGIRWCPHRKVGRGKIRTEQQVADIRWKKSSKSSDLLPSTSWSRILYYTSHTSNSLSHSLHRNSDSRIMTIRWYLIDFNSRHCNVEIKTWWNFLWCPGSSLYWRLWYNYLCLLTAIKLLCEELTVMAATIPEDVIIILMQKTPLKLF